MHAEQYKIMSTLSTLQDDIILIAKNKLLTEVQIQNL